MSIFSQFIVSEKETIKNAFRKQTSTVKKFLLVVAPDKRVLGIVTDGDFRRAILASVSLDDPISTIMNRNFKYFEEGYNVRDLMHVFMTTQILQIPILKEGQLSDIIFREDMEDTQITTEKEKIDLPVVIMAGGKGKRLDPFTKILPKPLIPVGEKSIIEIIMDKFSHFGMFEFFVSINHMGNMIRAYFEYAENDFEIQFIEEQKPMGTIGALGLLNNKIEGPFFVSNCDIVVDEDYSDVLRFHQKGDYILTILGSMQHFVIPYGVLNIKEDGALEEINEKPEYDFLVNTGLYLFDSRIFDYISEDKRMDMNTLIEKLTKKGERIGVYPVAEQSWIDIGQWEMYHNSMKRIMKIK